MFFIYLYKCSLGWIMGGSRAGRTVEGTGDRHAPPNPPTPSSTPPPLPQQHMVPLTLTTNVLHMDLHHPDQTRARVARYSGFGGQIRPRHDLMINHSYICNHHIILIQWVIFTHNMDHFYPPPISSPRGSIFGFWG